MSEERKPIQKSPLSHILGVTSDAKKRTFSEKHSERPDPKRLRDAAEPESAVVSAEPQAVNGPTHHPEEAAIGATAAEPASEPATEAATAPATEPTPNADAGAEAGAEVVPTPDVEVKTEQSIEPETRNSHEPQESQQPQEPQDPQEPKEPQEPQESQENQESQEKQESTDQVPTQEDGDTSAAPEPAEPPQTVETTAEPEQSEPAEPVPPITIDSSNVLDAVADLRPYVSGVEVYHPGKLLFDNLQDRLNSRVWVRIPREHLSRTNPAVQRRKVWGTDVYTDDSDMVAALFHTGWLDPESEDEIVRAHAAGSADLAVLVTLLPKLLKYTGCYMNELNSRSWGSHHDGISFQIQKVVEIPAGTADYPQVEALDRLRSWGAAFQQQRVPGEPAHV